MKAIEQCFHVVLFIMLYKVVLTFQAVDETFMYDHSHEAIEQYCHMEQSIKLYKVVLTFTFVDGTIACDH